jgi:hypothetical protein
MSSQIQGDRVPTVVGEHAGGVAPGVTGLTTTVHQEHRPRVVAPPAVPNEMDALESLEPYEL